MMAWKVVVRSITLMAAVCCLAGAARADVSQTVSPTHLTFALPTGATAPTPTQTVTFLVTGSGSVTVFSVSRQSANDGTPIADFAVVGDTCTGKTVTAPGSCSIDVAFSPSQPAGFLEQAQLVISTSFNESSIQVPLSGAAGAIKLFDPSLVEPSNNNASLSNPFTYGSTTLTLSCPAEGRTGTLASSPDGIGFVLEDNYVTVAVNGTPASTGNNPAGNVCQGGPADSLDDTALNDCFSTNYQVPAGGGQLNGQDPDTFASPGNLVLQTQGENPNNAGGVTPIDISSFLAANQSNTTFTLLDGGGFVAGASLFLVTNCTVAGVQTGGTVIGNPIDPNSPGSLTPTFNFNNNNNQHIAFAANYLTGGSDVNLTNTPTPQVADTAIPPGVFPSMVAGTSAGPAVCMRFSGELDANKQPQCKAFTITCTIGQSGTAAGANCPQSTVRDVLFKTAFDSPDTPTSQSQIAPGTGPGFLMGTDNWGNTNCSFTDPNLVGQRCPQDVLTSFSDPVSAGTTRSTNSTFVAVLNMPLPSTRTRVTSENIFGWQRSTTVKVDLDASPANYPVAANTNPLPANGFSPAPIASVTFGTNSASNNPPVPDPTFPVANDLTVANGTCPNSPGGLFDPPIQTLTQDTASGQAFTEGRYNLHYFATDCASTEELRFTFNANPAANWASFKTVQIRIDGTAPSITASNIVFTGSPKANVANTVSVTLKCTDPVLSGDGTPGSGVVICGPALFFAVPTTPSFRVTIPVGKTTHGSFQLPTIDLAGNIRTVTINY